MSDEEDWDGDEASPTWKPLAVLAEEPLPDTPDTRPPTGPTAVIPAQPTGSPAIADPVGKMLEVDGRILSEGLMYKYGYEGFTYDEIAGELAVSVLWLERVIASEKWLETWFEKGAARRRKDAVAAGQRSIYRLAGGHEVLKQKVDKMGTIHTLREEVSPNMKAVEKILETQSSKEWGSKVAPPPGTVNNTYIQAAQVTLDQRRRELAESERATQ